MRFGVLGPVELVADDGTTVTLGSRAQRSILAVLLARPRQVVSADVLSDALWGDEPPVSARASLQAQVSRLRKVVGDSIEGGRDGYRLEVEDQQIDAARFDALLTQARQAEPATALALLDEALAMWRGTAFGELADLEQVRVEALRLDDSRVAAEEARAVAALGLGEVAVAAGAAEAVVAEHPLRESAWATLIRALAVAGRTADALRAYQRASGALAESGLAPGPELRSAEQEALAGVAVHGAASARRPPAPVTELIGRAAEVDGLLALLDQARLVTLVGPGGVGKTRLAVEVARARADRHRLGARVAALAQVARSDAVAPAVADVLGLADAAALDGAGELDLLLVLDNCEHVVDAVAEVVPRLLGGGERLKILATSRERVGVDGEHGWQVAPLATIGRDAPARHLFEARAKAASPGIVLDPAEVGLIVGKLDGLPLALEMAAAQLSTTTVAELLEAIEADVGGLSSRRRDVDARHVTLRAVLEWSEALLDDACRDALADFSVFAGSVGRRDLAAAIQGPAPARVADQLVERSLLVAEHRAGRTSYAALETVRRHGRDRLSSAGRLEPVSRRHAEWFAAEVGRIDGEVRSTDEPGAHRRFDDIFDELRAAHAWARSNDPALAARIGMHAHLAAYSGFRNEVVHWAAKLAERITPQAAEARLVYATLGANLATVGRLAEAVRYGELVLASPERDQAAIYALEALTDAALYEGRLDECQRRAEENCRLATEVGDLYYVDMARVALALALAYQGDVDGGIAAVEGAPTADAPSAQAWIDYGQGEVVLDRDPAFALAALDRAVERAEAAGNRFLVGVATVSASSLRARAGDVDEAIAAFAALLDHYADSGDRSHHLTALKNVVTLLVRIEQPRAAAELWAAVVDDGSSPSFGVEALHLSEAASQAEAALGAADFAAACERGAGRRFEAAAAVARAVLAEAMGESEEPAGTRRGQA